MSRHYANHYFEPVHCEPYVSPDTGMDYLILIRKGNSGKYWGNWQCDELEQSMYLSPGYKTIKGAVNLTKRMIASHEDILVV